MSTLHILDRQGSAYRVAFHIPVPAGNNSAGLAWVAVLLKAGASGTTVLVDGDGSGTDGGISTAEKAAIVAGTTYEVVDTVGVPPNLTTAQLNAVMDALFAAKQTEVQATIAARYAQYGRVH